VQALGPLGQGRQSHDGDIPSTEGLCFFRLGTAPRDPWFLATEFAIEGYRTMKPMRLSSLGGAVDKVEPVVFSVIREILCVKGCQR
jgi:hypothetical protein